MPTNEDRPVLLVHLHLALTEDEVAQLAAAHAEGQLAYAQATDAIAARAIGDPDREGDLEVVDAEEL